MLGPRPESGLELRFLAGAKILGSSPESWLEPRFGARAQIVGLHFRGRTLLRIKRFMHYGFYALHSLGYVGITLQTRACIAFEQGSQGLYPTASAENHESRLLALAHV